MVLSHPLLKNVPGGSRTACPGSSRRISSTAASACLFSIYETVAISISRKPPQGEHSRRGLRSQSTSSKPYEHPQGMTREIIRSLGPNGIRPGVDREFCSTYLFRGMRKKSAPRAANCSIGRIVLRCRPHRISRWPISALGAETKRQVHRLRSSHDSRRSTN